MKEMSNKLYAENLSLLTIAIPTYNRAEYLDLCLSRIFDEINSLSLSRRCLVSVYVSNNASTDNTSEVLSKYKLSSDFNFVFVNNSINIGGDKNIIQCYLSALSPYVWVLGDDDVILSGGLEIVLNALIKKKDVDILYLSGYSYSNSYLDEPIIGRGRTGLTEFSNPLDFVRRTHIMLTFITALVVRSGVCLTPYDEIVQGTYLSQMSWILSLIRDGKKFLIINDRVYAAKIENSGGYGAVQVFGNNLSNISRSILCSNLNLANAIENGAIVMWFPIYIVNIRAGSAVGFDGENTHLDLRRVYKNNWRYYLFLAPLVLLPALLVPTYFKFIRLIRKIFHFWLI